MSDQQRKNLSVAEYFHVVQREYLIAEFRRKIYFSPKNKRYYERVMRFKREKIDDIARRNHLLSIFTSSEKMDEIRQELFDALGRPTFGLTHEDWNNYFSVNSDVSYRGEIWKLDAVIGDTVTLYNEREQRYQPGVNKAEITRIL